MSDTITAEETAQPVMSKSIVGSLLSISKNTRAMVALKLSGIDVYVGQDELLLGLSESNAVSVSVLADRASVRPSTISKSVDRLVQRGWLQRIADGRDARRSMVKITPSGLDAQAEIQKVRNDLESDITRKVPANELDEIVEVLDTVEDLLRQRLAKIR